MFDDDRNDCLSLSSDKPLVRVHGNHPSKLVSNSPFCYCISPATVKHFREGSPKRHQDCRGLGAVDIVVIQFDRWWWTGWTWCQRVYNQLVNMTVRSCKIVAIEFSMALHRTSLILWQLHKTRNMGKRVDDHVYPYRHLQLQTPKETKAANAPMTASTAKCQSIVVTLVFLRLSIP